MTRRFTGYLRCKLCGNPVPVEVQMTCPVCQKEYLEVGVDSDVAAWERAREQGCTSYVIRHSILSMGTLVALGYCGSLALRGVVEPWHYILAIWGIWLLYAIKGWLAWHHAERAYQTWIEEESQKG